MADWKTGVPAVLFAAMPLYTSGMLPGFDERLQLGLVITMAGTLLVKEVGPIIKRMKAEAAQLKVK
jgi:hypothetical protein